MTLDFTVGNLIALGVSIVGLLFQHFAVIGGIKERLTALETKMGVFWNLVETQMSKALISPHTPAMDALLRKLSAQTITVEELEELNWQLDERRRTEPKDTAVFLVAVVVKQRLLERGIK